MKINNDQFSVSRWVNLRFAYKRSKGNFWAFWANRFKWHYYPRLHYVSRFPGHLDIEISSLCNMQCPMCFTTTDAFKIDKKGLMEISLFKKIIDEAEKHNIYSIRISHRGEPFIHPQVIEFIRYAKEAGVKEVASLSNILSLTPNLFEEALNAGLDWLTISFDGIGDTYEKIRKPAKFNESYEKIKEYKRIKERLHSCKPVIKIQSIWPAVKDSLEEYINLFKPHVDAIVFNPLIDYLHKDNPEQIDYCPGFDCPVPYQRLTILFDGTVPYCHNDEFITSILGNVKKDDIYSIWHGKEMNKIRQAHRKHQGVTLLSACKYCFLPRKTESIIGNMGDRRMVVKSYTKRSQKIGS